MQYSKILYNNTIKQEIIDKLSTKTPHVFHFKISAAICHLLTCYSQYRVPCDTKNQFKNLKWSVNRIFIRKKMLFSLRLKNQGS